MTSNKIQETTNGLRRVNELLGKYVQEQALCYEEKRELWLFYKEHKDMGLQTFATACQVLSTGSCFTSLTTPGC